MAQGKGSFGKRNRIGHVWDMYGTKDDVNPRQQITWIKGVGMNFGLFMPYNYFMMEGMSFGALLCAYNGEEQVYMSPAGETYGCEYWREPAEGIENHSVAEFKEGRIYNLLGIEVPDSYNGIVIQNGKKESRFRMQRCSIPSRNFLKYRSALFWEVP